MPGKLTFPKGVGAIGVVLRPEAYRLFNLSMSELSNHTLEGGEVFGAAARGWQDQWMDAPDLETSVARVQRVLAHLLEGNRRADSEIDFAVRVLKAREGQVRVDALARELGWSRRHLDRRFNERVGIPPKVLGSILRFHAAYKALRAGQSRRGYDPRVYERYFDQAHFIRDFKRYAGMAPTGFRQAPDYGKFYVPVTD